MKDNKKFYNIKNDTGLIGKFLYFAYKFERPSIRKFVIKMCWHFLGGQHQFYSLTLRRIFKDYHKVDVGLYSNGECFVPGAFSPNVTIGRYCSFAKGVCTHWANHPINTKSIHPFFFSPSLGYIDNDIIPFTKLEIGNDVWIGQNALILPGCKYIGDGSIIGGGSVVNKDIPPYSIVTGNPARIVMKKFSDAKIEELLRSKWWEKSIEELIDDIDSFTIPIESDSIR